MPADTQHLVHTLLERHGQTFADEIGIPVEKNQPSPLFQLLVASLLFSARIAAHHAAQAARALIDAGLTTPRKMAAATWQDRVDVITWHGYKRYDESTSTRLGEMADLCLARYGGDLRRLRHEADRDVSQEKALLMEFKGVGPLGADIFLREVQLAWDEVYPYADDRILQVASRLQLPATARGLAELVPRRDLPRLVAALIRVHLEKDYDAITRRARGAA
jgi:endonuclease III